MGTINLRSSHTVLNIADEAKMLDFYCNVLDFTVTDRGPLPEGGSDLVEAMKEGDGSSYVQAEAELAPGESIIFASQDPNDHHQIAFVTGRPDCGPECANLNHLAFRVGDYDELTIIAKRLNDYGGIDVMPLSHGNTLSLYFHDPELNGLEVLWDTPIHVAQPAGVPNWDVSMNKEQAIAWLKEVWGPDETYESREQYFHRHADIIKK